MSEQNYGNTKLNDIVFEGRNKKYGAYMLRESYNDNVKKGLILGIFFVMLGISALSIMGKIMHYMTLPKKNIVIIPKMSKMALAASIPPSQEKAFVQLAKSDTTAEPMLRMSIKEHGKSEETLTLPVSVAKKMVSPATEDQPQFKEEGLLGLYRWLGNNIKYPQIAQTKRIEGKAIVKFFIETDGSITNVNCVQSPKDDGGIKEEAERVVSMMPNWIPGKENGRPIRTAYTLPIFFKLE